MVLVVFATQDSYEPQLSNEVVCTCIPSRQFHFLRESIRPVLKGFLGTAVCLKLSVITFKEYFFEPFKPWSDLLSFYNIDFEVKG